MAIITFTSDYGLIDHRVSAVKGKLLTLNANAQIVDITHDIEAYNLLQTSYIVSQAYSNFPAGTVHILCVDCFFSKARKSVLYLADGHYFLAADNGLLSLIFNEIKPDAVYEITLNNRFDDEVKFTPVDIFAPVAAHLINGGLPEVIGRKYKNPKQLAMPHPVYMENDRMVVGEIIYIDNFGNVVSNISRKFLEKNNIVLENFLIKFRNLAFSKIYNRYTDLVTDWNHERDVHGNSLAIFNDAGFLELTIYKGNKNNGAKSLFGLHVGEKIFMEFL